MGASDEGTATHRRESQWAQPSDAPSRLSSAQRRRNYYVSVTARWICMRRHKSFLHALRSPVKGGTLAATGWMGWLTGHHPQDQHDISRACQYDALQGRNETLKKVESATCRPICLPDVILMDAQFLWLERGTWRNDVIVVSSLWNFVV